MTVPKNYYRIVVSEKDREKVLDVIYRFDSGICYYNESNVPKTNLYIITKLQSSQIMFLKYLSNRNVFEVPPLNCKLPCFPSWRPADYEPSLAEAVFKTNAEEAAKTIVEETEGSIDVQKSYSHSHKDSRKPKPTVAKIKVEKSGEE